ncbi:MAG: glutamine synthetase family protein, partial [Rhodospirillales bacterium]|nr:glutamine synthetase family protein [Rhodospirillales bacterium]
DISGRVRGKAVPAAHLAEHIKRGIGWTPTNVMITAFGPILDTPFGGLGDVLMRPLPETEVKVDFGPEAGSEHFLLAEIVNTDGTPWACCLRNFLARAVQALQTTGGVHAHCAFEQEFVYTGAIGEFHNAYTFDAFRRQGAFAATLVRALGAAGIRTESILAEYAPGQYEITYEPGADIVAAERAIVVRELARATAGRFGQRATFTPILRLEGVGSGVHIHMSFRDADGRAVTYDPAAPFGLSRLAAYFVAGVQHHLPAICAVTAPSVISYIRLTPNRWAPTRANLALQDREAAIRICPIFPRPGADPGEQFNFEFRVCDAAASPYLALGAVIWAGVEGIRRELPLPAGGGEALPHSLGEALDRLAASAAAKEWFGEVLLDAYLRHKRSELALVGNLDPVEQCRRYAEVY